MSAGPYNWCGEEPVDFPIDRKSMVLSQNSLVKLLTKMTIIDNKGCIWLCDKATYEEGKMGSRLTCALALEGKCNRVLGYPHFGLDLNKVAEEYGNSILDGIQVSPTRNNEDVCKYD